MNENDHHPLWLHCTHVIKSTSMNYVWVHLYRSHYIHGWKWPSSIWLHCIRVIKSASMKLEIKAKKSRMWKNCPVMLEYTCMGLITFMVENDHHPYGCICIHAIKSKSMRLEISANKIENVKESPSYGWILWVQLGTMNCPGACHSL